MSDIKHHGILGMKWGVRRNQKTLDRLAGRKDGGNAGAKIGTRLKNKAGETIKKKAESDRQKLKTRDQQGTEQLVETLKKWTTLEQQSKAKDWLKAFLEPPTTSHKPLKKQGNV